MLRNSWRFQKTNLEDPQIKIFRTRKRSKTLTKKWFLSKRRINFWWRRNPLENQLRIWISIIFRQWKLLGRYSVVGIKRRLFIDPNPPNIWTNTAWKQQRNTLVSRETYKGNSVEKPDIEAKTERNRREEKPLTG